MNHLQDVMGLWVWICAFTLIGAHGWFIYGRPWNGAIHLGIVFGYWTVYVAMWGFS